MIVISDSTPLISLMKAGQLNVLKGLYGEILIPGAVYSELTVNDRFADEMETIRQCAFIRVVSVKDRKTVNVLQRATGLDLGGSEAIVCADDYQADVLLIDEKAGRRVARTMGLHIQGTIGVLLQAYDQRLLTAKEIDEAIEKLRNSKRHISEEMFLYAKKYMVSKSMICLFGEQAEDQKRLLWEIS